MPVIVLASSKGGPGKTTLSQLLVGQLAAEGHRVEVLDADPTGALHRWVTTIYEGPPVPSTQETDDTRLAHLIAAASDRAAVVVVDTAGFGNKAATLAMLQADLVLVPMLPGEADAVEAARTVALVHALEIGTRRAIPVRVVVNRVRPTKLVAFAVGQVDGLPKLAATLAERTAYGEIGFTGRMPQAGKAAEEAAALVAELRAGGWVPRVLPQDVKTQDARHTTEADTR